MNQFKNLITKLLLFLAIYSVFTTVIYANSAEPPCLTVIVSFPVEDLNLSIRYANGNESNSIILKKEQKAWETYYRFFCSKSSLYDAVLVVNSSEKNIEFSLPTSSFNQYNNLLTLDLKNEKLLIGQVPFRTPLLIFMRVTLTLIIEGLIFFLFKYRKKSSWITFLCINLITQGVLNLLFSGPYLNGYWVIGYVFIEIIIFIVEAIAFAAILKEFKKGRAVSYALIANTVSLILGALIISYLPV